MLNNRLHLYFPQLVQQIGWLFIFFGLLVLVKAIPIPNQLVSVPFLMVGLVFSLTSRGTSLDLEKRKVRSYIGLLGIKIGNWQPLPELHEIVFTSGSYSQQVHSWVSRHDVRSKIYRGFLKGRNDVKMLFSASRNPQRVKGDVEKVADSLNLPAIDYTVKPPNRLR